MFTLKQPCPAGSKCEIQLTYDQNGMVHVLAKQLGTDNQAEAIFDSRTGEVSGWVALADAENEGNDSLSEQPFSGLQENEMTEPASAPQLNAVLVKVRRQLMRLSSNSEGYLVLSELIKKYEILLQRSSTGEDCDNDLEELENKFEEFIGG